MKERCLHSSFAHAWATPSSDGDRLLEEYDGAGTRLRVYAHGPGADEPFVWYELTGGPQQRYLYADHQGSIVGAADANGNLISINTYDEYGIPGAGNTGRFQYTGQAWLAELGMYYYKARIYSPTLGRFMQTDPIGYKDQYNLYEYVGDDPVNNSDPTGLYVCNGNGPQCGTLRQALRRVEEASHNRNLTRSQRNELASVRATYGREGQRNGVVADFVSPREIARYGSGAAYTKYDARTGESHLLLPTSFPNLYNNFRNEMRATGRNDPRLSRFSPSDERANIVAHEGRHASDQQRLRRELYRSESHPVATQTGNLVNRAFGSFSVQDLNSGDQ